MCSQCNWKSYRVFSQIYYQSIFELRWNLLIYDSKYLDNCSFGFYFICMWVSCCIWLYIYVKWLVIRGIQYVRCYVMLKWLIIPKPLIFPWKSLIKRLPTFILFVYKPYLAFQSTPFCTSTQRTQERTIRTNVRRKRMRKREVIAREKAK